MEELRKEASTVIDRDEHQGESRPLVLMMDIGRTYPDPATNRIEDSLQELGKGLLRPWETGTLDVSPGAVSWALSNFGRLLALSGEWIGHLHVRTGIDVTTYESTGVLIDSQQPSTRLDLPVMSDWDFSVLKDATRTTERPNIAKFCSHIRSSGGERLFDTWGEWFKSCHCAIQTLPDFVQSASDLDSLLLRTCPLHRNLINIFGYTAEYWATWKYVQVKPISN